MKAIFTSLLFGALLATLVAPGSVALAQPPPPPPPPPPTAVEPDVRPGAPAAADAERSPAEPPLRDLTREGEPAPEVSRESAPAAPERRTRAPRSRRGGDEVPFGNQVVPAGRTVREAVSIFGSTTIEGEVRSDAVSVMGHTTIGPEGRVEGGAVAVLGRVTVNGSVGDEVVSVLGGVTVNGRVGGDAIVVLGDLALGPRAEIGGDVVVVGGAFTKHPEAVVRGKEVHVPFGFAFGDFEWLSAYMQKAVLLGRPLATGRDQGWAWGVALGLLAFYIVLALLFRRGIDACTDTLERKPGPSVVAAFLTVLLVPGVIALLLFTVIGIVLVPFLLAGLFFASLFGKAVMLAWVGRRITRVFGENALTHAAFAVAIGGVLILGVYLVPVLGFLVFTVLTWLGTGVVVYTLLLASKPDRPPMPAPAASAPVPPAPPTPVAPVAPVPFAAARVATSAVAAGAAGAGVASVGAMTDEAPAVAGPGVPAMALAAPALPPPPAVAAMLPRATLLLRIGALLLDLLIIAIVVNFARDLLPFARGSAGPGVLLVLAMYAAVMWKYKGTTIGGIVCGLKIVRLDGRELDWPTAVVRALGCFLSLIVAGLGFIWIAIDDEKQSWHDKIAGTVVVRMPKGVSLI
jgi:uncharacterized RDD family membrane protein YckC